LNTVDGEKSWTRSLECALAIYYGVVILIALGFIVVGCKVAKVIPIVP
jgi:hypothetical protein